MATAFIIFGVLAMLNFVLDGIIAPTLRLSLRYQLFELRDKLRNARIKYGQQLDSETYRFLENGLSRTINRLANISPSMVYEAHRFVESHEDIKREVERIATKIDRSPIQEVREIAKEQSSLFAKAMVCNSIGWSIYIVPIIFVAVFFKQCAGILGNLIFLPEREMNRFLPPESLATA